MFKEDLDVVKKSITIRTMLEDLGVEDNETEDEVKEVLPLPNIDSEVLELILQWCRHHKDDPDPEKEDPDSRYGRDNNDKKIYEEPDQWDRDFISKINIINELGEGILFDIMIAANYLHIEGLINSTTNELAKLMRDAESGKDGGPGGHEGIRKKFNLPDDIGKGDDYIPQPGDEGYVAPTADETKSNEEPMEE